MSRIDDLRVSEEALVDAIAELSGRLAGGGISATERQQIQRELPRLHARLAAVRAELAALSAPRLRGPASTDNQELSALASQLDRTTATSLTVAALIKTANDVAAAALDA
jgi:hypothetical protein